MKPHSNLCTLTSWFAYCDKAIRFGTVRIVGVACAFILILASASLDWPNNNSSENHDEINFAGLAVSLATQGRYKATTLPDHLMKTEAVCASNPTLYPYCSALAVRLFGVARWSVRLPSLACFLGGFLSLYLCCEARQLGGLRTLGTLACYLGSPWFLQAGILGRPEMFSVCLCYLATAAVVCGGRFSGWPFAGLICAAWLSTIAVWNSPLCAGLSVLPFLIGAHYRLIDVRSPRAWLAVVGGGGAALLALLLVFVYPHWDAWAEQFPRNALTYSTRSAKFHGSFVAFVAERLIELKTRASVLGLPFSLWYVASAGWLLLSRFSREAWIAVALTGAFLIIIDLKTPTHYYTLTPLAAAVPLIFLLVDIRHVSPACLLVSEIFCALLLAGCFLHPLLLFPPRVEARAFARREALFQRLLHDKRPAAPCVSGPLELAFPAWKAKLRYLAPTPGFFEADPEVRAVYQRETLSQATLLGMGTSSSQK